MTLLLARRPARRLESASSEPSLVDVVDVTAEPGTKSSTVRSAAGVDGGEGTAIEPTRSISGPHSETETRERTSAPWESSLIFEEDASALTVGDVGLRIAWARSFILTIDPPANGLEAAGLLPTDGAEILGASDFELVEAVSFPAGADGLVEADLATGARALTGAPAVEVDEVDELDAAEDGRTAVWLVELEMTGLRDTDEAAAGREEEEARRALFDGPALDGDASGIARVVDAPFLGAPLTKFVDEDDEAELESGLGGMVRAAIGWWRGVVRATEAGSGLEPDATTIGRPSPPADLHSTVSTGDPRSSVWNVP